MVLIDEMKIPLGVLLLLAQLGNTAVLPTGLDAFAPLVYDVALWI